MSRKGPKRESAWRRLASVVASSLFGREVDEVTRDRLQEIKGLFLVGFSLWLFVAMVSFRQPMGGLGTEGYNWAGGVGFYLADSVFKFTGWASYVLPPLGVAWGVVLVTRKEVAFPALRLFGGASFLFSMSLALSLMFQDVVTAHSPYGSGGWIAGEITPALQEKFGGFGIWMLLIPTCITSFTLATEMAFYPSIAALGAWISSRREERDETAGQAVWQWVKRLSAGLWGFLLGAGIEEAAAAPATEPAVAEEVVKPKPKKEAKKLREALQAEEVEAEEEEEEGDEEEEWEEEYEEEEEEYEEDEYEDEDEEEEEDEWEDDEDLNEEEITPPTPKKAPTISLGGASDVPMDVPEVPDGEWQLPSLELLQASAETGQARGGSLDEAAKLENTLLSFGLDVDVVHAQVGPAVTLYELEVPVGVRLNKIAALSNEIAAALKAESVRVIAPIPGKGTVGVEVPNSKRRIVRMRELLTDGIYDKKKYGLPLLLGMDTEGDPIIGDLTKMPHLLIAGQTGSGKSVCINTVLGSLLLTRSPHEVKMILVDPKMVELQPFSNIPHLLLPVVTNASQAANVLNWVCEKMEGRYELLKDVGVRNIKGYNALSESQLRERLGDDFSEERTPRQLPYIVIVVDEMADLMMVSKKEAEAAITRLAQKSRAVGIHVILATQRPSTDVITGVLKGNLPTRVAFQVTSKIDSRVILDEGGADKLLGSGDMLYKPPGSNKMLRVQGAFVEDDELQAIIDHVINEAPAKFNQEMVQAATGSRGAG
ncbi:MAG: DNA translocase FtsK 4TM domain-containing protein, partial [Planctomycetes bacterium]|nr:DNA translocase FtsK 4TM domain-containing protein [Planctomycetota bacterium]